MSTRETIEQLRLQARADRVASLLVEQGADIAPGYGEPGHDDPHYGVLLSNWNNIGRLTCELLEGHGYELEWDDEWCVVDGLAYRTQPDSYHWRPTLVHGPDGEPYVPTDDHSDVIEAFESDYLGEVCAVPYWITDHDLHDAGYRLFEGDLETGWFPGQDVDPYKIADRVRTLYDGAFVVGRVDGRGQFDARFSIWYKEPA